MSAGIWIGAGGAVLLVVISVLVGKGLKALGRRLTR